MNQKGFIDIIFALIALAVSGLAMTAEAVSYRQPTNEKSIPQCADGTYAYPKDIRDDPCIMGSDTR